ncbi:Phosphatidylinositol (PI) 3-kinase [Tilletia horrida]|uniref:Phosphatidylinositol 3-kinase VPS34 n=1 Tax=Tilletia horrida TaxID=155126 RepID=A0AAN6GDF2_9BASI|nr:Phosphatidylinositol (PI) 3-kinase [Tilletia horrida]
MDRDPYEFVRLSDVSFDLSVRVSSLQGRLPRLNRVQLLLENPKAHEWGIHQTSDEDGTYPDLYVECQLWADNKPLSIPFRTAHKVLNASLQWKEWINIPVRLCDLPHNAQLTFTVHDSAAAGSTNIIGGTTFRLFGKKGTLKKAQQRLYLWPGVAADPCLDSTTPSKVAGMSDEMGRLEKLVKKQERGDIPHIDWLDKLAFRQIERIHAAEAARSQALFLYIDLPRFDLPIVFCEQESLPPILPSLHHPSQGPAGATTTTSAAAVAAYNQSYGTTNSAGTTTTTAAAAAAAAAAAQQAQGSGGGPSTLTGGAGAGGGTNTSAGGAGAAGAHAGHSGGIDASLFTIADPEIARENPVEAKHRRLVRSHRSGPLDRELKPNAAVRDELNAILAYPPTRPLLPAEMDRIWSFRFYLTRDPKGLTKFLKSVVWSDPGEAKQATEVLLPMWTEPAIDDGLELLGPTFRDPRVRSYAVRLLERAGDEELMLYLLQLVQALKFDNLASLSSSASAGGRSGGGAGGANPGASGNGSGAGGRSGTLRAGAGSADLGGSASSAGVGRSKDDASEPLGLTDFLIARASQNEELGNNFFWYLRVECEDKVLGKMFRRIKTRFVDKLKETDKGNEMLSIIRRQETMLGILTQRARELRHSKDQRPKKIEKLRAFLSDGNSSGLAEIFDPPLILPLDPKIRVTGIVADKSSVFKSNLFPLLLQFEQAPEESSDHSSPTVGSIAAATTGGSGGDASASTSSPNPAARTYGVIMKNGDDFRQDQLVIQLFTLMDKLLRNENLDLKMTPYRVLATGPIDGIAQYVPSLTIAAIMAQYGGSLLNYLRHHHPDETSLGTFGVKPAVLDTFVRSCAGYCVVTYLLGVGDRHLDNLLLAPDGHFFHVDFGYILNRDPKPFPPPVKVCKEMVDGMGGTSSPHYARFKSLCHTAFSSLRKSSNLILNLVALMVDANVPDIKIEPDKAVLKVQEKFRLDLTEDEAIKYFEGLLNDTSYLAAMFDRLHDVAQYFRQ